MSKRSLTKELVAYEQEAASLAKKTSRTTKSLVLSAQVAIENQLDQLIVASTAPTITLISKRVAFENFVRQEMYNLYLLEKPELDNLLKIVYNDSRTKISSAIGGSFDVTNDYQLKELINRATDGATYSARLYRNNAMIAERINTDIAKMVYQNASPADIKRALAKDMNISYNSADRLIRTETSKFYNNAAIDSYKAAGLTEIEWLTEEDDRTCDICGPLDGKRFPINSGVNAPAHVNCRCTILPVID